MTKSMTKVHLGDSRPSLSRRPAIQSAKEMENYYNAELTLKLKRWYETAGFERIFRVRRGEGKKPKPDVSFLNGGVHLISGKFGERFEMRSFATADEYKEDLKSVIESYGQKLGEVFAVTYPAGPREKFHLHVLPRPGRKELPFVLDSLDEVAATIKKTVDGLLEELENRAEPVLDEAERFLRWGAEDLSQCLRGVEMEELEIIFGGHGFFSSVLEAALEGQKREEALRKGTAYLFVNQVLFYVLLSQAADQAGQSELYPSIQGDHFGSPKVLRDEYFQRVRNKDYEPVYGFDVARLFRGTGTEGACSQLVRGVVGLAPKLDVPDLVGQVFQGLIPLEIRKPLGAHYTNPKAAKLLATLSIGSSETTVFDPACGSGTLLVASYQRKMALSGGRNQRDLHRSFVEKEITGIDAMAFAAHLAAVNLALQEPLLDTDHVRIGTADSTGLKPGDEIMPTEEALPTDFRQTTLLDVHSPRKVRARRGPVRIKRGVVQSIRLHKVGLVIMNPPFTSRDNMAKEYRDLVDERFRDSRYKDAISGKKISQQAYFLLLADRFLEPGGRVAAVLPLNTFVGFDYWPLINFLTREYTIEFLIAGLGRAAFSEDTSLSECLLVARKEKPPDGGTFRLVGTLMSPEAWDSDVPGLIADAAMGSENLEGYALVKEFPQASLATTGGLLSDLVLRLVPEYDTAKNLLEEVFSRSSIPLVNFKEWREKGATYQDRIEPVRHLNALGASALLAVRGEERALKRIDRMIFQSETGGMVTFRDVVGGAEYRFPVSEVQPCVRRLAYLKHIDVNGETDFCVKQPGAALEKPMERIYGRTDSHKMLNKLRADGFWRKCCEANSFHVLVARRIDLAAPGTTLISCRSSEPVFNTTNFAASGFKDANQEKLFCLWMNSSMGLLQLVAASPTRGSWVGIQRNIADKVILPDHERLSSRERDFVETLWTRVSRIELKSLLQQLEENDEFRSRLDDGLLEILGISNPNQRAEYATRIRLGASTAIRTLRRTMVSREPDSEDENVSDGPSAPE